MVSVDLEDPFLENAPQPKQNQKIQVTKDGPYIVSGGVPLYRMIIRCDGETNTPVEWVNAGKLKTAPTYSLCRCGQSKNKPFCDGSHAAVKFDGKEDYDNVPFNDMAKTLDGPGLTLKDAEILCASARFCHRGGDIWDQISQTNKPEFKENCIKNACDCPSGRLVVKDKATGETVEPKLEAAIGLIEDPAMEVDGPLWVMGGIPVYSAEGKPYEVRNRMTLCRCGKSTIKPFCDSSHYPEENREER